MVQVGVGLQRVHQQLGGADASIGQSLAHISNGLLIGQPTIILEERLCNSIINLI
jgi:hypothetical protein